MSPVDAARGAWDGARRLWDHWQITILVLAICAVAIFTHEVDVKHNDDVCASVTQVRDAVQPLTIPASAKGVTDPATLARIEAANATRRDVRQKLEQGLACR